MNYTRQVSNRCQIISSIRIDSHITTPYGAEYIISVNRESESLEFWARSSNEARKTMRILPRRLLKLLRIERLSAQLRFTATGLLVKVAPYTEFYEWHLEDQSILSRGMPN
jgi:hypothetical protein